MTFDWAYLQPLTAGKIAGQLKEKSSSTELDDSYETMPYRNLASYKRFEAHLTENWSAFHSKRGERLKQHGRFGGAAEHVAENIVEDLFTIALDWDLGDINN